MHTTINSGEFGFPLSSFVVFSGLHFLHPSIPASYKFVSKSVSSLVLVVNCNRQTSDVESRTRGCLHETRCTGNRIERIQ